MDQTISKENSDLGAGAKDNIPIDTHPKAYLHIMAQQDLEETDYPIYDGESSIGRGVDCDLSIEGCSLSRKHAVILVEAGAHFVQDNDSRNKTFRGVVQLRPMAYYELTNGCELTFADIKCQYFFGPPPEVAAKEEGSSCEQTQAYDFGEEDMAGSEREEGGRNGGLLVEGGAEEAGKEEGGLVASESHAADRSPEIDDEKGEMIECEPTVAYDLLGEDGSDTDASVDEEEESGAPSPPLLTANSTTGHMNIAGGTGHSHNDVCGAGGSEDTKDDDDDTDGEEAAGNEGNSFNRSGIGDGDKGAAMEIDPTVAYDMDTDLEDEEDRGEGLEDKETKGEGLEAREDKGEGLDDERPGVRADMGRDEGKTSEPQQLSVTPPAPVVHFAEVSPTVPCGIDSPTETTEKTVDEAIASPSDLTAPNDTDAIANDSESIDALIPAKARAHSKQKTVFSLVAGKGKGKGKRGGGRGRRGGRGKRYGRTAAKKEVEVDEEVNESETISPAKLDEEQLHKDNSRDSSAHIDRNESSPRGRRSLRRRRTRRDSPEATPQMKTEESKDMVHMELDPPTTLPQDSPPSLCAANATSSNTLGVDSEDTTPVDESQATAVVSRRGKARGGGQRKSVRTSGLIKKAGQISQQEPDMTTSTNSTSLTAAGQVKPQTRAAVELSLAESPDIKPLDKDETASDLSQSMQNFSSREEVTNEIPLQPAVVASTRGRGKRGRGATGTGRKAAKKARAPVKSPSTKSKDSLKSSPTLHRYFTPSSVSPVPKTTDHASPCPKETKDKPRVLFTGITDKKGEKTVRELGGELVDSVYHCTHLVTDKVRRTVKFLCCLSRGCMIVSDSWLDACGKAGYFLPAKTYLVKDKGAEKQHGFSLAKSHETAKQNDLLSGYQVHLTPGLKPEREQMTDIIKCSGGEALDFASPVSPGEKVVIVSCEEDLSMCEGCVDAGVPVYSAELILGGVLRQQLDFKSHLVTPAGNCRKRRAVKEMSTAAPASKRRRK